VGCLVKYRKKEHARRKDEDRKKRGSYAGFTKATEKDEAGFNKNQWDDGRQKVGGGGREDVQKGEAWNLSRSIYTDCKGRKGHGR